MSIVGDAPIPPQCYADQHAQEQQDDVAHSEPAPSSDSAGDKRRRPTAGKRKSIRHAARYGSGIPVDSSLDEETARCATEPVSPRCMLRNSNPIRNSRIALATAMIEICLPVKIKF